MITNCHIIAGDFNSLDTGFLECDFGSAQIVNKPTHGNHILDKFFTNRPDVSQFDVVTSLIKTKHEALLTLKNTLEKREGRSCVNILFARKCFSMTCVNIMLTGCAIILVFMTGVV